MTEHTLANMHLQDRERMKRENSRVFPGHQFKIARFKKAWDRSMTAAKEHLGTSDKAVIFHRRLLLKTLQEMDEGKPLPGQDPSLDYDQRACSFNIPTNIPWQKVVELQEEHERGHPLAAE